MGEKKKSKPLISKSGPLILKSKPLIFCPLKTRRENAPKTQTNSGTPFRPNYRDLRTRFSAKIN